MRILFVTDLHGNTRYYDRLCEVAREAEIDVVINGGDMLPKACDLFQQDQFITTQLVDHFSELDDAGIRCLCYLGNDDLRVFDGLFEETCDRFALVTNLAQRLVEIDGQEFVGMNWVVDYPFRLKDRCRKDTENYLFQPQYGEGILSTPNGWENIPNWPAYAASLPTIEDELNALPEPQRIGDAIYVIHMPPYGIGLDECWSGTRVGSLAITAFLADKQPRLSLHGHIHESPRVSGKWSTTIGRTTCVQPGQGPELTYVIVDTKTGDVSHYPTGELERGVLAANN